MDNNNPLTLDDSGKQYWSYHTKQWFPLTVDDSGNWFQLRETAVDVDDPPEQQSKENEEEEDGQDQFNILEL